MATGKVRFEFSGAGAAYWYAHFLPGNDTFISPSLFSQEVAVLPTQAGPPIPTIGGGTLKGPPTPPAPLQKIPKAEFQGLWITPSPNGHLLAGAWSRGVVNLHALEGTAPKLQPLGGLAIPSALAFTRSGEHLAALYEGALHVWQLGASD